MYGISFFPYFIDWNPSPPGKRQRRRVPTCILTPQNFSKVVKVCLAQHGAYHKLIHSIVLSFKCIICIFHHIYISTTQDWQWIETQNCIYPGNFLADFKCTRRNGKPSSITIQLVNEEFGRSSSVTCGMLVTIFYQFTRTRKSSLSLMVL